VEDLLVKGSGRYVRMNGTQSATGAGYSLQEFEVYSPEVQLFPQLSIRRAATNTINLSWPVSWGGSQLQENSWLNWGGYFLQQASNLATTNWTDFTGNITPVNGTNLVNISPGSNRQFYRLRSP